METGVKTDMVSGRPLDKVADEKRLEKRKAEQARLKADVEKLGLSQGADGRLLQEMVKKAAIGRIEKLIEDDPEMKAYVNILKEMGNTENIARRAYEKLHGRHLSAVE